MGLIRKLSAMLLYSSLAAGCSFDFVEGDGETSSNDYGDSKMNYAACAVDSMKGYLGKDPQRQEQIDLWGPEAFKIVEPAYTNCFSKGSYKVLDVCQKELGIPINFNPNLFPLHVFLTEEGYVFLGGVLGIENMSTFTSDLDCTYNPQKD